MATLDQLHKQLESLEQLRSIVKTMKALSAANIHQFEQAVDALIDYYRTLELGLHVALRELDPARLEGPSAPVLPQYGFIVFGSDHGLCGRFNEEIVEHAQGRMDALATGTKNRRLLAIGSRMLDRLESAGLMVDDSFLTPGSASQIAATVQRILLHIDHWREEAGVNSVYLCYNRHSRHKNYQPIDRKLLPVNLRQFHRAQAAPWPSRRLPIFTMDRQVLVRRLLDQYLFVSVFRACAESQASEHASRLMAMQSAQRNLDERLNEVTGSYRRARQSVITSELLDLASGFEALKPKHSTD